MNGDVVYVTKEGYESIERELRYLIEERRPEVALMIREAKEDGDLRENAAYDDAKDQQAFVEGRIQHLEDVLSRAQVIESPNGNEAVAIGSQVTVVEKGKRSPEQFRIVGSAEANPRAGLISNQSLLGRSLIGLKVGDTASYETPDGETLSFKIVEIA
ncbi:MAG: transcription elongation factor GreA [Anaerolineae bacterium]|jgi:transcription elongation factor GreA